MFIEVVGALGDSLTVGVGARAESILDIGTEYRTVSFSIGGEGTWRDMVTLPNLLKLFNPDLYGASRLYSFYMSFTAIGPCSLTD